MKKKDNRIRLNKRMVAWSNGERTNVIPSVWREVDDCGSILKSYYAGLREGDEFLYGSCDMVREACRCRECEADRLWERGRRLDALTLMLRAAAMVLPDETVGCEFEDAQWLDPDETLFWHPNVREHLRLMRRCEDLCRREPRLRPLLDASRDYRNYRRYLQTLGRWVHE